MDEAGRVWFESFRKHIRGLRAHSPVPARAGLSPAAENQCQIIGSALIAWLERYGPELNRTIEAGPAYRKKAMGLDNAIAIRPVAIGNHKATNIEGNPGWSGRIWVVP